MYPADVPKVVDLGLRHFALPNGYGGYMWWHDCPAVAHISWGWFGEDPTGRSGHVVATHDPLTVRGSLICTDCGDHGYIISGAWVAC